MNDASVQKKRCEKRETAEAGCFRGNQSEALDNVMEVGEGERANRDDSQAENPGCPWPSFFRWRIEFHGHPQEGCDFFPPLIRWLTIKIGAARFLGELLHFGHCERLACRLG